MFETLAKINENVTQVSFLFHISLCYLCQRICSFQSETPWELVAWINSRSVSPMLKTIQLFQRNKSSIGRCLLSRMFTNRSDTINLMNSSIRSYILTMKINTTRHGFETFSSLFCFCLLQMDTGDLQLLLFPCRRPFFALEQNGKHFLAKNFIPSDPKLCSLLENLSHYAQIYSCANKLYIESKCYSIKKNGD